MPHCPLPQNTASPCATSPGSGLSIAVPRKRVDVCDDLPDVGIGRDAEASLAYSGTPFLMMLNVCASERPDIHAIA